MNIKLFVSALAACTIMSGTAMAERPDKDKDDRARVSTEAGGVAAAGRHGAVAAGAARGHAAIVQDRRDRRRDRRDVMIEVPNSATTSSSGAVYTDRNNSSAAVTSSGSATGSGTQSTGSTVSAYGETTRQGSYADIYGDSVAVSENDDEPDRD